MMAIKAALRAEGGLILTFEEESMHACADLEPDEFDGLMRILEHAHLESKLLRS